MNNNIQISPEKMMEKAASITIIGKKYQEKVNDIFFKVVELGNYWQGEEYNIIKSKFEQNKIAMDELGTFIMKTIPNDISSAVTNYMDAQNNIRNII